MQALWLAPVQGRAAAHAMAARILHHAAIDAAEPVGTGRGVGRRGGLDLLPDGVAVDRQLQEGQHHHQRPQHIKAGADGDARQIMQLGQRDQGSDQEHVEHGPTPHTVGEMHQVGDHRLFVAAPEIDQHQPERRQAPERGQDRDGQHHQRDGNQLVMTGHAANVGAEMDTALAAAELQPHEGIEINQREQHQGGEGEGARRFAMIGAIAERAAAARAIADIMNLRRRQNLQQPAIGTFQPMTLAHGGKEY